MPLPADVVSLAASTLARKWKMDVDVSAAQDGSDWRRVKGCTDVTVNPGTAGMQPDTDYDGEGYQSSSATTLEWGVTATLRRAPGRTTPTQYDPGQEFLRLKAKTMAGDNTAHIRVYEYNGTSGPKVEAYDGYVGCAYANGGGGADALSTATLTLSGQGALLPITHPDTTLLAPVVNAVIYPTGASNVIAAGGDIIRIKGVGFLVGVTAVTVFGNVVTAANRHTISDNEMVIKVPAHAAGTGNVTVTNATGTSATAPANQIVYV